MPVGVALGVRLWLAVATGLGRGVRLADTVLVGVGVAGGEAVGLPLAVREPLGLRVAGVVTLGVGLQVAVALGEEEPVRLGDADGVAVGEAVVVGLTVTCSRRAPPSQCAPSASADEGSATAAAASATSAATRKADSAAISSGWPHRYALQAQKDVLHALRVPVTPTRSAMAVTWPGRSAGGGPSRPPRLAAMRVTQHNTQHVYAVAASVLVSNCERRL